MGAVKYQGTKTKLRHETKTVSERALVGGYRVFGNSQSQKGAGFCPKGQEDVQKCLQQSSSRSGTLHFAPTTRWPCHSQRNRPNSTRKKPTKRSPEREDLCRYHSRGLCSRRAMAYRQRLKCRITTTTLAPEPLTPRAASPSSGKPWSRLSTFDASQSVPINVEWLGFKGPAPAKQLARFLSGPKFRRRPKQVWCKLQQILLWF